MIKWKLLTIKEKLYYSIWVICGILVKPFMWLGNLSTDKLNKSYYKQTQDTKCSMFNCNNECYKGETFEYNGKDYCSEECLNKHLKRLYDDSIKN